MLFQQTRFHMVRSLFFAGCCCLGAWRVAGAADGPSTPALSRFAIPSPTPSPTPPPNPREAARLTRLGVALGDGSAREGSFYQRALAADRGHAPAWRAMAACQRRRGNNDAALEALLGALAAEPTDPTTHLATADLLIESAVDPLSAEGDRPRLDTHPHIRRLELARYHLQRWLTLSDSPEGDSFRVLTRARLAEVEDRLAKMKNARPESSIEWRDAARRLRRSADPRRSPYEGPRLSLLIDFGRGAAEISFASTWLLDAVARALDSDELRDSRILIEGHADSDGDSATNLALSRQRALSVRDYLVARGLPSDRFIIAGYGATRPLAANATPEQRRLNRRIEIVNWDEVQKARGVQSGAGRYRSFRELTPAALSPTPHILSPEASIPPSRRTTPTPYPSTERPLRRSNRESTAWDVYRFP